MLADKISNPGLVELLFYQGQLFASSDLRLFEEQENRMRYLHTATLHNAFGILEGLQVEISGAEAHVKPGVAVDICGVEIRISRDRTLPLPLISPENPDPLWVLILRPRSGSREDQTERPKITFCEIPPDDSAELFWRRPGEVITGFEIPLIGFDASTGQLILAYRRRAQPLRRPKVGSASFEVSLIDLKTWLEQTPNGEQFVGWQHLVDTSPAGFQVTPHYMMDVKWIVVFSSGRTMVFPSLSSTIIESIAEPTPRSYLLRLSLSCIFDKQLRLAARSTKRVVTQPAEGFIHSGLAAVVGNSNRKKTLMSSFINAGGRVAQLQRPTTIQFASIFRPAVNQAIRAQRPQAIRAQQQAQQEEQVIDTRLSVFWFGVE